MAYACCAVESAAHGAIGAHLGVRVGIGCGTRGGYVATGPELLLRAHVEVAPQVLVMLVTLLLLLLRGGCA